ncbi:MAG: DUF4105 domain-containing protein [Lentisphaerota bacterium]
MVKFLRFIKGFIKYLIIGLLYLWCIGGVYYLNFIPENLRSSITWLFILVLPLCLIIFRRRWFVYWIALLICLSIAAYYKFEPASNDGDWDVNWAVVPSVTFKGDEVNIKNIRDFQYRSETDFIPHYYDKTFDLNDIDSLYYVLSYWDGNKAVAHSILSFGFKGGDYLCISVETRLKKNQPQTGIGGLYNQYGLLYILADERDVLRLRTNFRKEEVYMYQVKPNKEMIRALFTAIINRVDKLKTQPQFYNTVKHSCLTSLLADLRQVRGESLEFDYRHIFNGYSDELFYEKGAFTNENMPFAKFKEIHHINQYIKDNSSITDYSKDIRQFETLKKE